MRIIHGAPSGRANYVIWAMKEMGLDFEINPVNPFKGETKKPEYLALNPLGQVPTLEEDGFILWESMAINFYLAKNYGAKNNGGSLLWSDDPREEAEITQWSLFGILYLDKQVVNYILHKMALPEDKRDPAQLPKIEKTLTPHLKVLDDHLSGKDYMLGGRFTLADLNLAAMLDYTRKSGFDFSPYANLQPWLARCLDRPARQEMNAKR